MNKICVLHSGGMDSTCVILWYLSRHYDIQTIYIDYGQATAPTEWNYCKLVAGLLHLPSPVKITGRLNHLIKSHSLISGKKKKYSEECLINNFLDEFFPNRNLYLLTLASIYCFQNNINEIALGIIDGGEFSYTDTNAGFLRKANSLFSHTLNIKVNAPLIKWDKQHVVQYLKSNNMPVENTYSCNIQNIKPCGKCAGCIERNLSLK